MTTVATPLPAVSRERAGALALVVPAVSLLATAGMATSAVALLPAAASAAGLLVLAVVAAATGRRNGRAHRAVEPLGMAFMLVLAAVHGHSQEASVPSHAHGGGWVVPALTFSVAALSAVCLVSALADLRRALLPSPHRPVRGSGRPRPRIPLAAATLACVSAAAMCAMSVHTLFG